MSWIEKTETVMQSLSGTLGIPYDFERNESPEDQLPDTYMVYFVVDDQGVSWADGKERARQPRIQASLFYRDKRVMLTVPKQIENTFTAARFLRVGSGRIPYQESTGHYGWRCDFRYYERG